MARFQVVRQHYVVWSYCPPAIDQSDATISDSQGDRSGQWICVSSKLRSLADAKTEVQRQRKIGFRRVKIVEYLERELVLD